MWELGNRLEATLQDRQDVKGQMAAYPRCAEDGHQSRDDPSGSDLSHASVRRDDAAERIASIHAAPLLAMMQQSNLQSYDF